MKTKYCPTCQTNLNTSEFNKNSSRGDGLMGQCRKCVKAHYLKREKTKDGLLCSIYKAQKASSKKRGYEAPSYSKEEFIEWAKSQKKFHILFKRWEDSSFKTWERPSIDRIDDYKSYTLLNIQIMTWKENNKKGHKDRRNGLNNKMSKAVIQWGVNGEFISEHYSMSQASRDTNISVSNICNCCKGKRYWIGGFIWTYKFCPL